MTHALGPVVMPAHVETRVETAVHGGEMGKNRGRLDCVDWGLGDGRSVDRRVDRRQDNGREMIVAPASALSLTVT